MSSYQLNSKNKRHWNCFLSSVATDGKDRHGFETWNSRANFFKFNAMTAWNHPQWYSTHPDLQIRGCGHPDPEVKGLGGRGGCGGRSPKNFFRPFGPQSGLKISGGEADPPKPLPWIPHWCKGTNQWFQHRIDPKQQHRPRDVVTLSPTTI